MFNTQMGEYLGIPNRKIVATPLSVPTPYVGYGPSFCVLGGRLSASLSSTSAVVVGTEAKLFMTDVRSIKKVLLQVLAFPLIISHDADPPYTTALVPTTTTAADARLEGQAPVVPCTCIHCMVRVSRTSNISSKLPPLTPTPPNENA
eukprot:CAMPEP_0114312370 /NCGR_PEP_ID=MMETSP0059-20121206/20393_1 /TAXON_ID=36894 /ORGANISM="Pyramimonas parkeae, Strain CCMP726" /LENGTH=146 /DNA_ID=CAMNT_0001436749 /DNA_START=423 /DNA_END=860 /DNA_ORIENTATION=-